MTDTKKQAIILAAISRAGGDRFLSLLKKRRAQSRVDAWLIDENAVELSIRFPLEWIVDLLGDQKQ